MKRYVKSAYTGRDSNLDVLKKQLKAVIDTLGDIDKESYEKNK